MSNSTMLTVTIVLVLGHTGALLLSVVLLKRIGPVIWLNLVVALVSCWALHSPPIATTFARRG